MRRNLGPEEVSASLTLRFSVIPLCKTHLPNFIIICVFNNVKQVNSAA